MVLASYPIAVLLSWRLFQRLNATGTPGRALVMYCGVLVLRWASVLVMFKCLMRDPACSGATVGFAFATLPWQRALARFGQGLGLSATSSAGIALVGEWLPPPHAAAAANALDFAGSMGLILGPIVGGVLHGETKGSVFCRVVIAV